MTSYRKARHADVNGIMEIMNANLSDYEEFREFEAGKQLPERFTDMFVAQYLEIDDAPLFVAVSETADGPLITGSIIALCESLLNPDLEQSEHLHITNLDVRSDYRRQGIATGLLECVEEWARERNFSALFIETYTSNTVANRLLNPDQYETVKEVRRKRL